MGCKSSTLTKTDQGQGTSDKDGHSKPGPGANPKEKGPSNVETTIPSAAKNSADSPQERQKGSSRKKGEGADDNGGDASSMSKKKNKGPLRDGSMCSSPNHSFNAEFTGSFRNLSFVDEKGDCKVERAGTMRPSQFTMAAKDAEEEGRGGRDASKVSSSNGAAKESEAKRRGYIREEVNVSTHPSDNELVLICLDCGLEISEETTDTICPLTGKLHS